MEDDIWELDAFSSRTTDEISKLEGTRKEPLTKDFLRFFFGSDKFKSIFENMATRAIKQKAEGGFIVYKKAGSNNFVIVTRFGTSKIDEKSHLWQALGDQTAHISLEDNASEIRKLLNGGKGFVRIGDLHFHPSGSATLSMADVENYEENYLGKGGSAINNIIPAAFEGFRFVAAVPSTREKVNMLGICLPFKGLLSNVYQSLPSSNQNAQIELFKRSGFRVAKVEVPLSQNVAHLDQAHIERLAVLGG